MLAIEPHLLGGAEVVALAVHDLGDFEVVSRELHRLRLGSVQGMCELRRLQHRLHFAGLRLRREMAREQRRLHDLRRYVVLDELAERLAMRVELAGGVHGRLHELGRDVGDFRRHVSDARGRLERLHLESLQLRREGAEPAAATSSSSSETTEAVPPPPPRASASTGVSAVVVVSSAAAIAKVKLLDMEPYS